MTQAHQATRRMGMVYSRVYTRRSKRNVETIKLAESSRMKWTEEIFCGH
uniref:Uncharacterized protein n=1 Tax=Manihot esculenta TaxID=3983 RepID=A0A2C9V6N5_MANES